MPARNFRKTGKPSKRPADVPYDSVGESDKGQATSGKRQVEKVARTGNPECRKPCGLAQSDYGYGQPGHFLCDKDAGSLSAAMLASPTANLKAEEADIHACNRGAWL
jgi:hypothetical protein